MKKIVMVFLSVCIILTLSFAIIGCNSTPDNNNPGNNFSSSGDNDNDSNSPTDSTTPIEYKRNIASYKGKQEDDDLQFVNSININDEYYLYYFKLGTIYNCPIYSSLGLKYEYDTTVKFTFDEITEEGIENSFTNASETIDTHSYTGGFEITLEQEVEVGIELAGLKVGGTRITTESTDYHWTNNWGSTTSSSNTVVDTYLKSYSTGYSETVNFCEDAGFVKGNFYRLSFYEPLIAYGVLIYDVTEEKYSVSYQELIHSNNTIRAWDESADSTFSYPVTNPLYFDVNKAIEYAENHKFGVDNRKRECIIDLSSYYSYESNADLSTFSHDYYDQDSGIFTAYGSYQAERIDTYIFRGAYGLADDRGRIIRKGIDGFSICISSEHDIEIVLENMYFVSAINRPAVYRNEDTENSDFNDLIRSNGVENIIKGREALGEEDGSNVFQMNNLTIVGTANLILQGGKGGNGSDGSGYDTWNGGSGYRHGSNGIKGGDGGNGIVCDSLIISDALKLTVIGGDGGSGGNGGNGGGSNDRGTSRGGNGGNGGDGGVGGSAIKLNSFLIIDNSDASISLKSGNGGVGGNGGNGGHGIDTNTRDSGGNGGNGGIGGNSGYCISALHMSIATNVEIYSGNGGNGGMGGSGGNAYRDSVYGSRTYVGNGGNGGNGGDCVIILCDFNKLKFSFMQSAKTGDGGKGGISGGGGTGVGAIHWGTSGIGGNSGKIICGEYSSDIVSGTEGSTGKNSAGGIGGVGLIVNSLLF